MKLADFLAAYAADPALITDEAPEGVTAATADALVIEALDAWDAAKATGNADLAIAAAAKKGKAWSDMLKAKKAALDAEDSALGELRTAITPPPAADTVTDPAPAVASITVRTLEGAGDQGPTADTATPQVRVAAFTAAGARPHIASSGDVLAADNFGRIIADVAESMSSTSAAVHVASLRYIDADAPRLGGDSPRSNTELLASGREQLRVNAAKTAAANANAGFCGMPQYLTAVPNSGTAERPLTGGGALREYPIDGTIIKHYRRSGLASVAGAARIWLDSDQKLVDPASAGTWKPTVDLACNGTEISVTPYMVWAGAQFDTFQELARPDRVSELQTNVLRLASRVAEKQAWDTIITLGGTIGTTIAPVAPQMSDLAGLREVIVSIMAHCGYDNRDPQDGGWGAIFPYGFAQSIAVALGNRADDPQSITNAKAEIDGMLSDISFGKGVYMLDDPTGYPARPSLPAPGASVAASTLPTLGTNVWTITLYDRNSVFHGKRGVFNAGVERGPQLTLQNRALFRVEDMECVGRDGENAPITVKIKLPYSGARAAYVTYNVADADLA